MRPCYGPLFLSRAKRAPPKAKAPKAARASRALRARRKKGTITWAQRLAMLPCAHGPSRGIFDIRHAPYVREANERTTGWIISMSNGLLVGLQPTVIASRAPHLLLVDVHRPSMVCKTCAQDRSPIQNIEPWAGNSNQMYKSTKTSPSK